MFIHLFLKQFIPVYLKHRKYLTVALGRLALFLAEFSGVEVVGVAEAAAEDELAAVLPLRVVVPARVVAGACALHHRQVACVCAEAKLWCYNLTDGRF